MSEERRKQIASSVVLASHGNRNACKDVYVYYHKNIFFISRMFTGDTALSMELTADIFIKMFEKIQDLDDHTIFEQWFYSYTINMCRKKNNLNVIAPAEFEKLTAEAVENAKNKNKDKFNRNIMDILRAVFCSMPCELKVMILYKYFAGLEDETVAMLEKSSREEVLEKTEEAELYLEEQAKILEQSGINIEPFLEELENTLFYIAAKSVVFDSVHKQVSDALGVNVNPYIAPEKPKTELKEPEKTQVKEQKKSFFTKKDLIFFLIILAAAFLVFSAINSYLNREEETVQNTPTHNQQQSAVLVWNGASAENFQSGSGTKEDPYIIASGGQLAYLANLVNEGNSMYAASHYKLGADIILNNTIDWQNWAEQKPENEWTPIGYKKDSDTFSYFTGTFDGAGHTIYGMYVSQEDEYAGLFGIVRNGHIKNLCVSESYVKGGSYTGGIAGYFSGDATDMAGFEYCSFSGNVYSSGNNAGGITGYFSADGQDNTIVISDCCFFGSVNAAVGYAGGICGVNEAVSGNTKIVNCFNAGDVSAEKIAGGISGNNRCSDGNSVTEKCYNAGKITAKTNSGAISGILSCVDGKGKASVLGCYMKQGTSDVAVTKKEENERLLNINNVILTEEQMKKQESFADFNFSDIWEIRSESDYKYPMLKNTITGSFVHEEQYTA